jgi:uncharacterized protein
MLSRAAVDAVTSQSALAFVGLSREHKKFGNVACRELRARGYRVYAVHPDANEIDGAPCYRSLAELPERVEAVVISVTPKVAVDVIRAAAAAGIRRVWLQQGAESEEALRVAAELGVEVVGGECILMYARPRGVHRAHRWMNSVIGRAPVGPVAR